MNNKIKLRTPGYYKNFHCISSECKDNCCIGGWEIFIDEENDWEVYTEDGMPSAQWEIMVLVTEDGHEVLSW